MYNRGFLARQHVRKMLQNIPHSVCLSCDFAEDLPCNYDMFSTKPDTYLLANTFRLLKNKERCYTTGKTRVIVGNTSPVWEQELRLSTVGTGALIIINVMSRHLFGGDSIVGQCVVNFDKLQDIYRGRKHNLRLPVKPVNHAHYKIQLFFYRYVLIHNSRRSSTRSSIQRKNL